MNKYPTKKYTSEERKELDEEYRGIGEAKSYLIKAPIIDRKRKSTL